MTPHLVSTIAIAYSCSKHHLLHPVVLAWFLEQNDINWKVLITAQLRSSSSHRLLSSHWHVPRMLVMSPPNLCEIKIGPEISCHESTSHGHLAHAKKIDRHLSKTGRQTCSWLTIQTHSRVNILLLLLLLLLLLNTSEG